MPHGTAFSLLRSQALNPCYRVFYHVSIALLRRVKAPVGPHSDQPALFKIFGFAVFHVVLESFHGLQFAFAVQLIPWPYFDAVRVITKFGVAGFTHTFTLRNHPKPVTFAPVIGMVVITFFFLFTLCKRRKRTCGKANLHYVCGYLHLSV